MNKVAQVNDEGKFMSIQVMDNMPNATISANVDTELGVRFRFTVIYMGVRNDGKGE